MSDLGPGVYETLVTALVRERLAKVPPDHTVDLDPLHPAEASDRVALHIAKAVHAALEHVDPKRRVNVAGELTQRIVSALTRTTENESLEDEVLPSPVQVLNAILAPGPDGRTASVAAPDLPLLDSTLLTNAPGEPRVGHQLLSEIPSADRIDVVMAFVRSSGIRPLIPGLRRHREQGKSLRLLTTTYTGSTQGSALQELAELGAEVRVSYDTSATRLHAKAWLFHRDSGFSTAYIGSSNLTHSAQVTGLEWNVRLSAARNPTVLEKIDAVFESYWHSGEFVPFDLAEFRDRTAPQAASASHNLPPTDLHPLPFQRRLLEKLHLARERGHHRNLLVSATGTGKTVMAALDFAQLREHDPRARLLFVAHRREILEQSLLTFRHALREPAFGELWVGGQRPERFQHVFASIQSLTASGLGSLPAEHFDVVIIDEFHHAAASTYEALLAKLAPRELLGLTATPERSDGRSVLTWFGNRIAAELRLWDAIDQGRLVPFAYYGVHDGTDLTEIPWRRGRGYDVDALANVYTTNDAWAHLVMKQLGRYGPDLADLKALGFCVSVDHARFMARVFTRSGVPATAVWADTPEEERRSALAKLQRGELKAVFSVDLFNEGVDVPPANALLLLRPTDSPLLFLQQLGRGLRKHRDKSVCTILDFVGRHTHEFRFDRRFGALLSASRAEVQRQVENHFPFLPAGCHMELDAVARDIVLTNIKNSVPSNWPQRVAELQGLLGREGDVTLQQYLDATGLRLDELYASNHRSWSDLREDAGATIAPPGPREATLRRVVTRLLHVDDAPRIHAYRGIVAAAKTGRAQLPTDVDRRYARMLLASLFRNAREGLTSLDDGMRELSMHPQVCGELLELLVLLEDRIDHITTPLAQPAGNPLQIHARYTRDEILAAFGHGDPTGLKIAPWQSGVLWLPDVPADLLAITLDKTAKSFSPTTRYRDYAINERLLHWESQSATRADSPTGVRYQTHAQEGSHVFVFARHTVSDRAFYALGPAQYVSHRGEKPVAVTWRLDVPLPGDLFQSFAAAVA